MNTTTPIIDTEKLCASINKDTNRLELIEPSEVLTWLPELKIIEEVTAKGVTLNEVTGLYEDIEVPIDNGYKLAGHVTADGTFRACPWMKSENYSETAHDYVLGSISDNLDNRGLKHGIWRSNLTRNLGCMRTDILLKEYYKVNDDAFEDDLGIKYNNKELSTTLTRYIPGDAGLYQPCVTVINSLFGASKVQFSLLRLVCLNGLHKIADKLSLSFTHMQSDILKNFEEKSSYFLDNVFQGKELENMIINMQNDHIQIEMFLDWMLECAGPKATEAICDQFNIGDNFAMNADTLVSRWIAYNMMTWATSHVVGSQHKQDRMFTQFQNI